MRTFALIIHFLAQTLLFMRKQDNDTLFGIIIRIKSQFNFSIITEKLRF